MTDPHVWALLSYRLLVDSLAYSSSSLGKITKRLGKPKGFGYPILCLLLHCFFLESGRRTFATREGTQIGVPYENSIKV